MLIKLVYLKAILPFLLYITRTSLPTSPSYFTSLRIPLLKVSYKSRRESDISPATQRPPHPLIRIDIKTQLANRILNWLSTTCSRIRDLLAAQILSTACPASSSSLQEDLLSNSPVRTRSFEQERREKRERKGLRSKKHILERPFGNLTIRLFVDELVAVCQPADGSTGVIDG